MDVGSFLGTVPTPLHKASHFNGLYDVSALLSGPRAGSIFGQELLEALAQLRVAQLDLHQMRHQRGMKTGSSIARSRSATWTISNSSSKQRSIAPLAPTTSTRLEPSESLRILRRAGQPLRPRAASRSPSGRSPARRGRGSASRCSHPLARGERPGVGWTESAWRAPSV